MPPSEDNLDAQGWTASQLLATAAAYLGVGSDADLPDDLRFLTSVTRLIRRRLAIAGDEAESELALFCLFPFDAQADADLYEEQVPMLDDGTASIGGCLWRVGPIAASGVPMRLGGPSDAEAFKKLEAIGAGAVPTIAFKPEASVHQIRFYPNGVERSDDYRAVLLRRTISMSDVLTAVDHVHHTELVTPGAQSQPGHTWSKPPRRPVATAEKVVQFYLKVGLSSAFPTCRIAAEQTGIAGRTDLEIEELTFEDGGVKRHALLELKVLRGCDASGKSVSKNKTTKWVKEGVEQAAAYRDERGTLAAALCCFDMRPDVTGDACFNSVKKLAKSLDVTLRSWHLFSTEPSYRKHMAEGAAAI